MIFCPKCEMNLEDEAFSRCAKRSNGKQFWCKKCQARHAKLYRQLPSVKIAQRTYHREHNWITGSNKPINKSQHSSSFLGCLAETILSKYFNELTRMPYGNPGYDYVCGKGFKIDVKASIRHRPLNRPSDHWAFNIKRNEIADFFLCLAFDNRKSLNPEHIWLIPGEKINGYGGIIITESVIDKWSKYEKPLNRVICPTPEIIQNLRPVGVLE